MGRWSVAAAAAGAVALSLGSQPQLALAATPYDYADVYYCPKGYCLGRLGMPPPLVKDEDVKFPPEDRRLQGLQEAHEDYGTVQAQAQPVRENFAPPMVGPARSFVKCFLEDTAAAWTTADKSAGALPRIQPVTVYNRLLASGLQPDFKDLEENEENFPSNFKSMELPSCCEGVEKQQCAVRSARLVSGKFIPAPEAHGRGSSADVEGSWTGVRSLGALACCSALLVGLFAKRRLNAQNVASPNPLE